MAISEPSKDPKPGNDALHQGDALRKAGDHRGAVEAYLQAATASEVPESQLCLKIARSYAQLGEDDKVRQWGLAALDAGDDFMTWQGVAGMLGKYLKTDWPNRKRTARVAILGSYTTTQFKQLLAVAAIKFGVQVEIYESHYGQYQQDIIDPGSELYAFKPSVVIMVVHGGELRLPAYADDHEKAVEAEAARWTRLWQTVQQRSGARVIQHNFAIDADLPMGHLGSRLPGSRYMMTQRLNQRLGELAGASVSIVDCERLAATIGKTRWFDPKYWHLSKQAVSLDALPLLARHTAAVLAADLGLSKKCLVLDLDNTLWGGIIGEDGLAGIKLGPGSPIGEAYVAFQEYILELKRKGIILAVNSKNNDADAREVFEKHPEMRIRLDDISMFVANWEPKPRNIQRIAQTLNIGIDSLVFVDDNPVERQAMREFQPEVDVIVLPTDPSQYVRALGNYLLFETSSFTKEDAARADQYRARAQIAELEMQSGDIEDFYRSLQMKAVVQPFDDLTLPRIAQLLGKTNQFNLTTRRHGMGELKQFIADPNCVHYSLTLSDRFADHGLVSLIIAVKDGDALDIDSWLMSCRVIGRTVEAELLSHLCRRAEEMGCTRLRGTHIPTAKNGMVKEIYAKFGFEKVSDINGTTVWEYDLSQNGPITNDFIENIASPNLLATGTGN